MLVKFRPFNALVDYEPFVDHAVSHRTFEPRIDVRESDKEFVIVAELPGLTKDDFKLTLENNLLTIEGEKKFDREEKGNGFYRSERQYGRFTRSFRLTDAVDNSKISAEYKDGLLSITVPKAKAAQPKEIAVNTK